jgi:BirA family biotin operon repressor/biotin-[acetyl-CoA-carboxylase] ligase
MPNSSLTAERISALCGAAARDIAIDVVAETGSTNADLLARVAYLPPRQLLLALSQTAGRGRSGRSWLSSADGSLTFSLAWKFRRPLHELLGLPLAVGVVIAETMAALAIPAQLKWPNDVLLYGKKLAGVLIESTAAGDQGVWAIIGIGLNVTMPAPLAAQIGQPVAHMDGLPNAAPLDRAQLLARLLDALAEAMNLFEDQGFAAFQARWNALHAHQAKAVVILDQGKTLHEGMARGVDAIGRLMLDGAAGPVAVMAGDVSLRVQAEA